MCSLAFSAASTNLSKAESTISHPSRGLCHISFTIISQDGIEVVGDSAPARCLEIGENFLLQKRHMRELELKGELQMETILLYVYRDTEMVVLCFAAESWSISYFFNVSRVSRERG